MSCFENDSTSGWWDCNFVIQQFETVMSDVVYVITEKGVTIRADDIWMREFAQISDLSLYRINFSLIVNFVEFLFIELSFLEHDFVTAIITHLEVSKGSDDKSTIIP